LVKHRARVIGIVASVVALWLGVGLTGVATRVASAEPAVDAAIRARSDSAAYTNLGFALSGLERWDEARLAYEQAVRLAPDDADAHYNMGRALNSLRRHAEAAEAYRAAVRIQPGYANAWGNLGLSATLIGRYDEAREAFERARALVPGYFESRPIQRLAWEIVSRTPGNGSR
jgi:tetratricopeptide (TPR) repeat protein